MRSGLTILLALAAALLVGRETAAWHIGRGSATDGDTVKIGETRFRLKGVAAPEAKTQQGREARDFVRSHFAGWIACRETGQLTFSRYEAFCYTLAGRDIGAAVIAAGLACATSNPKWRVERYEALARSGHPRECGYGA
jgi:endonuclease YncB( thermonuclease family)